MNRKQLFYLAILIFILCSITGAAQDLISGPEGVVFDTPNNRYLVANATTGNIIQIFEDNTQDYFVEDLSVPLGLHIVDNTVYVATNDPSVLKGFDLATGEQVLNIPINSIQGLSGICSDNLGNLYVVDQGRQLFKVPIEDEIAWPFVTSGLPNSTQGVTFDEDDNRLIVVGFSSGTSLVAVDLADSSNVTTVATGSPGGAGITQDDGGNFYIGSWTTGCIHRYDPNFENPPMVFSTGHSNPTGLCYNSVYDEFVVSNYGSSTVDFIDCTSMEHFSLQGATILDEDSDGLLEENESANIILSIANAFPATGITGTLMTYDENIIIETDEVNFSDIQWNSDSDNSQNPFVISISENASPHLVTFSLMLAMESGEVWWENFDLFVGVGDILLVDDDEGESYESYYTSSIEDENIVVHHHDIDFLGDIDGSFLANYPAVIWFTGNASENTLTNEDQIALANFLDNGGNLFITGQNIGDEIGSTSFYSDYLHAVQIENDWNGSQMVKGIVDDPIGDGLIFPINGGTGANNQTSPCQIDATTDAFNVFGYMPQLNGCAVRYQGDYTVVYFGFGFEAISTGVNRREVMSRIMEIWGSVGIDDDFDETCTPDLFSLNQNYPNPFNPSTTIAFTIPASGGNTRPVKLQIYDTFGKLIKTLIDKPIEVGYHSVVWNGKDNTDNDVASGVYFYRLKTNNFTETKQCLLLK